MPTYNVYGVSDWPKSIGQKFIIFEHKEFVDAEAAIRAAKDAYSDDLEIIVKPSQIVYGCAQNV